MIRTVLALACIWLSVSTAIVALGLGALHSPPARGHLTSASPVSSITPVPPYNNTLSNGFGGGPGGDGTAGLLFLQHIMGPASFIAIERRYAGLSIVGGVEISNVITAGGVETVTMAMSRLAPTSILLTAPCWIEYPIGSAAYVSGTIRVANLSGDRSGCCLYGVFDRGYCLP